MGILAWLRGQPNVSGDEPAETREFLGGSFLPYDYILPPGLNVSGSEDALRISTVWACVNLITNHIATMPFETFKRDPGGVPRLVSPRPALIDRPHPEISRVDWLTQVQASLLLRGNSYSLVVGRDPYGRPTALLPVDPNLVTCNDDMSQPADYRLSGRPVADSAMVHIRGLTLPGRRKGLSVVSHARTTMGASLATDHFASQYFAEGLAPSGVLSTDDDLDPTDADDLARAFESRHGRSRRPVVLTSGLKWQPLSISPEESQFLATREYQVHDICRLFGVPPHMVGATDKTTSFGAGIQAMNTSFHSLAVQPWLVRLEVALTDLLPRGQYVKCNVSSILRGTVTERYAAYSTALGMGLMNVDEMRALEELPPLPNGLGQTFYVSNLLTAVGTAPDVVDPDDADEPLNSESEVAKPVGDALATGPNSDSPGPDVDSGQSIDPLLTIEPSGASD